MPADVEIIMTDHGRGEVFIDGVKVPAVRRLFFSASAEPRQLNVLTLDLVVDRISIEGVAEVKEPRNEG